MQPTASELRIINSRLPGTTLAADQVEVLPFKLFDNQVTDRHTVMSKEMMKKIVKDANDGMIAMNALHQSHYTLPMGRSIEGKIITDGDNTDLLVKMYTVVQRPDGSPLEDGKDLADRYNTGAVYACSAGVYVGFYKCSICGNDIRDYQNCDHWPGETYIIDEKPVVCTALMTGKDIKQGMAMDCGCYECSAVTAGGVRKASVLTETFSKYDKLTDIKDFKKTEFEKELTDYVSLIPYKEEVTMSDPQENVILNKNYELVEAKAKVEVELATLKGEYSAFKTAADATAASYQALKEEFDKAKEQHSLASAEFTKQLETLQTELAQYKADLEAKVSEVESLNQLTAFKAAFISVVEANGVKIDKSADYATKTVEELIALNEEYLADIAKLPSGQQSVSNTDENNVVIPTYAGIPEDMFKTLN